MANAKKAYKVNFSVNLKGHKALKISGLVLAYSQAEAVSEAKKVVEKAFIDNELYYGSKLVGASPLQTHFFIIQEDKEQN